MVVHTRTITYVSRKPHVQVVRNDIHLILTLICLALIGNSIGDALEVVCKRADIRRPALLESLSGCSVIEGDLLITFTHLPHNAALPHLREITGSLLVYDVDGLSSLASLFPNLTVIRGQSLVYNYAIVIKATTFEDITMPSLRLIQRGGVRIENNPALCYANTVLWNDLLDDTQSNHRSAQSVDVRRNGDTECSNRCPATCPVQSDRRSHCWSDTRCQFFCSSACSERGLACHMDHPDQCCNPECLGGCYGAGPDSCVACRHVKHSGICVARCPTELLTYRERRCVTVEECLIHIPNLLASSSDVILASANQLVNKSYTSKPHNLPVDSFAIHQGSCLSQCPTDYVKDTIHGHCIPCDDHCPRKHCPELLIHDLRDLYMLTGCHSAVAIYLSIQDGEPEFVNRLLEESFARLRTIEQSLRIVRSPAITTLRMLDTLNLLGSETENASHTIVLEISENDNLQELWLPQLTERHPNGLRIRGPGSIRITQNRRLCPNQIFSTLFDSRTVQLDDRRPGGTLTEAESDLISLTNGDLAYCNWTKFSLSISEIEASSARVSWSNLLVGKSTYEEEPVLIFLFYQSVPNNTTIIREPGRATSDEWKMLTVRCDDQLQLVESSHCVVLLEELDPATRYALYVEIRYPLRRTGALSEMSQFITRSINPSPPRYAWLEPVDDKTLRLTWTTPLKPGGQIDSYLIWFIPLGWDPADHIDPNVCLDNPDKSLTTGHRDHQTRSSALSEVVGDADNHGSIRDQCQLHSTCPPLAEIEKLSNYQNHPNPNAAWPATVSLWTVDAEQLALPVTFVDPFETSTDVENITLDRVGFTIYPVKHSPIKPDGSVEKSDHVEYVQLLRGLPHFTPIVVELQACHRSSAIDPDSCSAEPPWFRARPNKRTGKFTPSELRDWSVCEAQLCSPRVTVTGRTKARVDADDIPLGSVKSIPVGPGAIRIWWAQPPAPNGVVLCYQLRYRMLPLTQAHFTPLAEFNSTLLSNHSFETNLLSDLGGDTLSPVWLTKCVGTANILLENRTHNPKYDIRTSWYHTLNLSVGLVLTDLPEGFYVIQLRVISLAGSGRWSAENAFMITSYTSAHRTFWSGQQVWVFFCGMIFTLVLLIAGFATVIYHARRRYLRLTAWTSTNPDYWTIYEVDAWEMDRDDIDLFQWKYPLGHGSFGTVYRGMVRHLRTPAQTFYPNTTNVPVAVKTINNATTLFDCRDFISEACHMKRFQSPHLVRLLGLVSQPVQTPLPTRLQQGLAWLRMHVSRATTANFLQRNPVTAYRQSAYRVSKWMMGPTDTSCGGLTSDTQCSSHSNEVETKLHYRSPFLGVFDVAPNSPLVVMELMSEGDLATYLRHLGDHGQGSILPSQAYLWATQIADGMAYLAAKHFVHRDLAARNCLVNERLVVKIGDFGLCRQVYDRNYYQKRGHGRLPIRWMAPESLESAYFTSQSDVWSFGVVLWEMATMASLPYRGLSHDQVIRFVSDGNTLLTSGCPTNCPDLFLALMLHCWAFDPYKRPTFLGLCTFLAPRFADSTFRLASFFYTGEPLVDPKSQVARLEPLATKLLSAGGHPSSLCATDTWATAVQKMLSGNQDHSTEGATSAAWTVVNPSTASASSCCSQPRTITCGLDGGSITSFDEYDPRMFGLAQTDVLFDKIQLVCVHSIEAQHKPQTEHHNPYVTQSLDCILPSPEHEHLLNGEKNPYSPSDRPREMDLDCMSDSSLAN